MIHFIGSSTTNSLDIYGIQQSTFEEFIEWEKYKNEWQLDCESTVTKSIVERKLTLIQFGDYKGRDQWVIDPRKLTLKQANKLVDILNNPLPLKLIHNSAFEITLLNKYGVKLSNVFDTMLSEKVLDCGNTRGKGYYSLGELVERYYFKELDKSLQTSFGVDIFTPAQIHYAADDVKYLGGIRNLQLYCNPIDNGIVKCIKEARLENVLALENEVVLAFSEIESNGMNLDTIKWRENIALAQPIIDEATLELNEFIRSNEFRNRSIEYGFLTDKEEVKINWNSPKIKKELFSILYPDLKGVTQPVIKKYIKEHEVLSKETETPIGGGILLLSAYLSKDYLGLNKWLETTQRDYLIQNSFLVESDKVLISWTSAQQKLKLFQIIEPSLKSVGAPALANCSHPIFDAYSKFLEANTLVTKFGEKYIEENLHSDGKIRTRFNQILDTGRVSSSKVNIQQVPAGENVGNRYRNCFIADKGWKFIDSDYSSQELCILADFSKDKVWAEALRLEQDLHGVAAEKVFKTKWVNAAEEGCKFYQLKEDGTYLKDKCKCKGHKKLRTLIKTINFGLSFGMTKYKLSTTAKISTEEAQQTIDEYFQAFPGIKGILDAFAKFGTSNGYIMTAKPFNRRRYYDYWQESLEDRKLAGQIDRASRNLSIQGTAADMVKLAMCLIYWHIKDNNLWDRVKFVCQVHDQLTMNVRKDYVDTWLPIMDRYMREAADFIITPNLLKAETLCTGNMWSK